MWSERQIDNAAAAAAEKANGGKFTDPLFYAAEHKKFWREVVRTALEAADPPAAAKQADPVTNKEIQQFSEHCVYIRSVYLFTLRLLRDCNDQEIATMKAVAPSIFDDLAQILGEYLVIAACRVTDLALDVRKNESFTVELFVNDFASDPETQKQLDALYQKMKKLRKIILPTRHKLAAHANRDTIRKGEPLFAASWQDWDDFWSVLADFVRLLNQKKLGTPFEITAGNVIGDAEQLLKALKQSQHFETLLNGKDAKVSSACIKLALA
jgi:AbiU2